MNGTIAVSHALLQSASASRVFIRYHKLMLEVGFEWDGMDGYTAPSGFTPEDHHELWIKAQEDSDESS